MDRIKENILGVIPARAGSKGIPNKNMSLLNGKPLISYSIRSALKSGAIDRLIVSTDSPEIAEISEDFGAEVPFMRPSNLASDTAELNDVIEHAINYMRENEGFKTSVLVILFVTSPLKRPQYISNAIEAVVNGAHVGTGFSPFKMDTSNIFTSLGNDYSWVKQFTKNGTKSLELFQSSCSFSAIRIPDSIDMSSEGWYSNYMTELSNKNGPWGRCITQFIEMDRFENIDINNHIDLIVAETIISRGLYREME